MGVLVTAGLEGRVEYEYHNMSEGKLRYQTVQCMFINIYFAYIQKVKLPLFMMSEISVKDGIPTRIGEAMKSMTISFCFMGTSDKRLSEVHRAEFDIAYCVDTIPPLRSIENIYLRCTLGYSTPIVIHICMHYAPPNLDQKYKPPWLRSLVF